VAFEQRSLDDYIDVAQRIADFREAWPEGSLQPADKAKPWEQAIVTGNDKDGKPVTQTFIVYVAAAYRHGMDECPGIGVAWEVFPGRTPYTRGSELQNAETSAWGRAIIAALASDSKRGVASREEVRNRQAEREDGLPANRDGSTSRSRVTDEQLEQTGQMTKAQMAAHNRLERETRGSGPQGTERLAATPESDPWLDQPAGKVTLSRENEPGSSDARQRQAIAIKQAARGMATPEAGRAECARIIGRDIATRRDLSFTEAAAVLAALDKEAASA
jgi:hypothetical protein